MFLLCSNMRWNHLPLAGGLYAQHPEMLEKFEYIFAKVAENEEKDRQEQERKQQSAMGKSGGRSPRVAGRRR